MAFQCFYIEINMLDENIHKLFNSTGPVNQS
jgi:hypothetical protein